MDGYEEAAKVDQWVHKLQDKYDIKGQPREWLKFCRTVGTTMDLLLRVAMDELEVGELKGGE